MYNKKNENFFFTTSSQRILEAINLIKNNRAQTLIVSGVSLRENEKLMFEGASIKKYAEQNGVEVIIDEKSRTTYENFVEAKKIIEAKGIQSAFLVTSGYHMGRAMSLFKNLGIPILPYSVELYDNYNCNIICFPFWRNIKSWELVFHEVMGLIYYKMVAK